MSYGVTSWMINMDGRDFEGHEGQFKGLDLNLAILSRSPAAPCPYCRCPFLSFPKVCGGSPCTSHLWGPWRVF